MNKSPQIVIDTCVLISALLSCHSASFNLLKRLGTGEFYLVPNQRLGMHSATRCGTQSVPEFIPKQILGTRKRKMDIPNKKVKIGALEFTQEESGEVDAVVDGQQRLTSLAGVLLLKHATVSTEEENDWNLHFVLEKENFVFPTRNTSLSLASHEYRCRYPRILEMA
ncbi:hypothetical protein QUF54_09090 [Candidatus Marithioploca araucensis]|uniref:DUF262 domain-containing protein n=1 Tax=Candidatus Marithioploca araucensis TaxID=70273 RepID=A0ABT7VV92_9GAMM|nr:hypothetical protein [Candidatus Marithioploca araucensis]